MIAARAPQAPATSLVEPEQKVSRLQQLLVVLLVTIPFGATAFTAFAAWHWTHYFSLKDVVLFGVFYLISSLGITVGFHRMLTHNGFDAPRFVRGALLVAGMFALEGSPISWTAMHTKHHAYSDKDEDPHSPLKGFLHAHVFWLFTATVDRKKYAKRQLNDPAAVFVSRTAGLWAFLGILLPFLIGGWTGLLWGAGVRIFIAHHVTWSVNSVCHTFGSRPFKANGDQSRNNILVGILAMGEGWHNNHHAFPRSAFHGLRWREFDASGYFIRMLAAVGLVRNVYKVPREAIIAKRLEDSRERLVGQSSQVA